MSMYSKLKSYSELFSALKLDDIPGETPVHEAADIILSRMLAVGFEALPSDSVEDTCQRFTQFIGEKEIV